MKKIILLLVTLAATLSYAQTTMTLEPESYVQYQATDPRETVTGQTSIKTLEFSFDPQNLRRSSLVVSLDASKFDSGNVIRDTNARRTVFNSDLYPEIIFSLDTLNAELNEVTEGQTQAIELLGTLDMHGVSKEISVDAEILLEGNILTTTGAFTVLLSDYEMSRPSFLVWTIEDQVELSFQIIASF